MTTRPRPRRGEVWLVSFDPAVGAEIRKRRPAVVISMDGVGALPLRVVVPLTSWQAHYANASWFVHVPASTLNGLANDSGADAFQVKSVSESRFLKLLGQVTISQLDDIAAAVALCVGAP